ncbi:MAG: hypothetical protein ACI4KF_00115 [Huintestinicola sp.]
MESVISYKCPNCGGELKFNADAQNFICEWCSSVFTAEEVDELCHEDQAQTSAQETAAPEEEQIAEAEDYSSATDLYVCPSCGAEIICSHETAASFCYYCHNPVSLKGRLDGKFAPELIIPFKFSRLQAENFFKQTCSKKMFLPSDFLTASQIEKITGLYVPFWFADCDVDAYVLGEAKKVTVSHRGDSTTTTTMFFRVDRAGKMTYMGVPADGSQKIDDELMDAVEPYNYQELVKFNMKYLSGYYADRYDVDKGEVVGRIKKRIEDGTVEVLKDDIMRDIACYNSVNIQQKNIRILKTKWHYVLLPVWFLTYRHNGTVYSYAINGQTGKLVGKYPVSTPKVLLAAALAGIAAFILTIIVGGAI